jgi:hypothetical protein
MPLEAALNPIYFAAIFASTMAAVAAAMGTMVRLPLGGPGSLVFIKAFLMLGAVISTAILALARTERRDGSHAPVLISMIVVLFLPCLAWPLGRAAEFVIDPVLIALCVAGALRTVAATRDVRPALMAVGFGLLAGLCYFVLVNSRAVASVLTPEEAIVGTLNMDTLFHSSIANMILKHGVLSIGADGLLPVSYHVLSHIWLGCIGLWLGTSTPVAYFVGMQVIGIPLLFFNLALAVYLLRPAGERLADGALVIQFPILFILLTEVWGWMHYFVSESYLLALNMFLPALPLLTEMARTKDRGRLLLQAGCLAVATVLIGVAKVSVGVVLLAATGFVLFRQLALPRRLLIQLGLPALVGAALIVLFAFRAFNGSLHMVHPFSFVREYPSGAWPNIVAILALLIAVNAIRRHGTASDKISAEVFAVIGVVAALPSLLLDIHGGSAYYFINIGTLVAAVVVSAYGGPLLVGRLPGLVKPGIVLVAMLLIALGTREKRRSPLEFADMFAEMELRTRGYLGDGIRPASTHLGRFAELLSPGGDVRRMFASEVERLPRAQVLQTLLSAGLAETPDAAVFVPPENTRFWTTYRDCRAVSLFIPAMLGAPMIRGLNGMEARCWREPDYGFQVFGPDSVSQPSTDDELCSRAQKWGLRTVFILPTAVDVRKIDCGR